MTGALWILASLFIAFILLRMDERRRQRRRETETKREEGKADADPSEEKDSGSQANSPAEECCGMHSVCVRMLPVPEKPVYFDDEELDRFAGRPSDAYSDEEVEEIRNVMLTLDCDESPEWAQSLKMRGIEVPDSLVAELDLLVREALGSR